MPTPFHRLRALVPILLVVAGPAVGLRAVAPIAPSGLTATTLGVNAFRLNWNDNSTNENLFRVQAKFVTDTTWNTLIDLAQTDGSTTGPLVFHVLLVSEFPNANLQFRMQAVKSGPPEELSTSGTATAATTPATSTFSAPTGLAATTTDGVVKLSWTDNCTSEWGYEIEGRKAGGTASFSLFYTTNPNQTSQVAISGHEPSTAYEYRVRGYKRQNPSSYTNYSSILQVTTQPLNLSAPGSFAVTRSAERDIAFSFTDPNDAETGIRLDYRVAGSTDWLTIGTVGANITSISPVTGFFDPATAYEFRALAFHVPAGGTFEQALYSPPSTTASANTLLLAPASLVASPTSQQSVQLSWTDNSQVQQGVAVYRRAGSSGDFELDGYAASDAGAYVVQGLQGGTSYEFQVRAAFQSAAPAGRGVLTSAASNTASAFTRDEMNSAVYVEAVLGKPFSHLVTATTHAAITAASVTNLPSGLFFHAGTRVLDGVATSPGVSECPVTLTFADGWTHQTTLTVRVLQPPQPDTILANREIPPNAASVVSLLGAFRDLDSETAVRVTTNVGNLHVLLYNVATPGTVSNFMSYVTAGDFADTVFHRSVPGFVVQGGAFRPSPTNLVAFTAVPTRPPVTNEPGLSSVRGTVAMAKLGGDPDSATNQWFVNLRNNGPILNNQNGGFTVFGRVPLADLAVPDAIAALPRRDVNILLNDAAATFEDWPLLTSITAMDNTQTVRIQSVETVPVLAYTVVSNSAPAVVSTQVDGGDLRLTPLASGDATLTVRATDLDGNHAEQTFTVHIPESFAFWASAQGLGTGHNGPHDNADGGVLDNFAEYAFYSSPTNLVDDTTARPQLRLSSGVPADRRLTAEFNLRKGSTLRYAVLAGSSLTPSDLAEVWSDRVDGLAGPHVEWFEDRGTHWRVRVRDVDQPVGASLRYLSLEVREDP